MRSCLVKGDVFHGSISPLKEERGCVCYTLRFDVNSRDRERGGEVNRKERRYMRRMSYVVFFNSTNCCLLVQIIGN